MTYLLILMLSVPGQPLTVSQIGPFHDLFACEKAAAQALIFQAVHPGIKMESFCASQRSYHLTMPRGKR